MKKRRQAADRIDRTQQSARQIENNGQERRRPRRRGWGTAGRVIGTILLVFVLTAAIFAGIFSAYINSSMRGRVEVYLDEFETKVSTELYYQEPSSGEWTMYHTLFLDSENRIWVDLEQIPKDLQKAVIAIEDKRFYKHKGVDWHGTARAIFSTIFGGSVQGGSTITQQLVKNVTGDNQNTVKRKVMEIYRAQEMEKRYEKDEILEAYLNEVYFGYSCYGVVTASLKYFNKDVSELSLAECASLVAITNNPSLYDPLQTDWGLENNRTRQLLVLGAMLEQGKTERETDRVLRDTYFVSPERRRLAIETAQAGLTAKRGLRPNEISLYVGIPFCPTRCAYCSFVSASVEKSFGLMEPYLAA